MLIDLNITPYDVLFFVIPLIMSIFFYARSAKSEIDRDKFILFILSFISITIWIIYLIRFFTELVNKLFFGFKY
jgi:membrane-associated HD superfamily phosphohydrolase